MSQSILVWEIFFNNFHILFAYNIIYWLIILCDLFNADSVMAAAGTASAGTAVVSNAVVSTAAM
jgi:hypothetical protein